MDDLTLTVKAVTTENKEYTITVEPTNFVWQNSPVDQPDNYENG